MTELGLAATGQLPLPMALLIAALAFLLSLWGTPIARQAAIRFGIVDAPDGGLKRHAQATPYMGGVAVYLAVLVTMLLVFDFERQLLGLLLAAELVLLVGLIDDLGALTPRVKFIGQLLAVGVLVKADVMTHIGSLPFWMNLVTTAFWLVAVMNAINIIDIMDGLATSVAAAAAAVLMVIALVNGLPLIAAVAAALLGSCLGFLVYNRAPARIYLGDAGSLFLGLMLGGLTMVLRYSETNELAILNPLLILSVPLFDTTLVSAIRLYRGQSPFRGSPDHYALRLRKQGWSVNQIVGVSAGATLVGGALALVNLGLEPLQSASLYVVFGALALGVALYVGRIRMP